MAAPPIAILPRHNLTANSALLKGVNLTADVLTRIKEVTNKSVQIVYIPMFLQQTSTTTDAVIGHDEGKYSTGEAWVYQPFEIFLIFLFLTIWFSSVMYFLRRCKKLVLSSAKEPATASSDSRQVKNSTPPVAPASLTIGEDSYSATNGANRARERSQTRRIMSEREQRMNDFAHSTRSTRTSIYSDSINDLTYGSALSSAKARPPYQRAKSLRINSSCIEPATTKGGSQTEPRSAIVVRKSAVHPYQKANSLRTASAVQSTSVSDANTIAESSTQWLGTYGNDESSVLISRTTESTTDYTPPTAIPPHRNQVTTLPPMRRATTLTNSGKHGGHQLWQNCGDDDDVSSSLAETNPFKRISPEPNIHLHGSTAGATLSGRCGGVRHVSLQDVPVDAGTERLMAPIACHDYEMVLSADTTIEEEDDDKPPCRIEIIKAQTIDDTYAHSDEDLAPFSNTVNASPSPLGISSYGSAASSRERNDRRSPHNDLVPCSHASASVMDRCDHYETTLSPQHTQSNCSLGALRVCDQYRRPNLRRQDAENTSPHDPCSYMKPIVQQLASRSDETLPSPRHTSVETGGGARRKSELPPPFQPNARSGQEGHKLHPIGHSAFLQSPLQPRSHSIWDISNLLTIQLKSEKRKESCVNLTLPDKDG